jgi:hypothetical protein
MLYFWVVKYDHDEVEGTCLGLNHYLHRAAKVIILSQVIQVF